jgi:hypothetical protein
MRDAAAEALIEPTEQWFEIPVRVIGNLDKFIFRQAELGRSLSRIHVILVTLI